MRQFHFKMSSMKSSVSGPERLLLSSLLALFLLIICVLSEDAIPTQNMSHKERAELR